MCANLASRGSKRSGRPASTVFCLTQSMSHEGRMMSISPLFCSDATLTVPGLCQFVSTRYLHRDGCGILLSATQMVFGAAVLV